MFHQAGSCWGQMLSAYVKVRAAVPGRYRRRGDPSKQPQRWVRVGAWCDRCGTFEPARDAAELLAAARAPLEAV